MDANSLSRLKELKNKATEQVQTQGPAPLDPSLFFTQLTGNKAESTVSVEDDIFSQPSITQESSSPDSMTEDDLFGSIGQVEINQSFNLEEEIKTEKSIIEDLQAQLQETKLINPKAEKAKEEAQETAYKNGSTSYVITEPDKPTKVLKTTRKSVKKSDHNDEELEGVDQYELILIKLFLQKIKK